MLRIHKIINMGTGEVVEVETLDYAYPSSLVKLRYRLTDNSKEKVFYLKVFYQSGRLVGVCKHSIAKRAKEIIREHIHSLEILNETSPQKIVDNLLR